MIDQQQKLNDAWLGIEVEEGTLFNPMDFVFDDEDKDKLLERIAWLMMRPEYFSFACKYILNIELSPFQALILYEMWNRKFPMLIGSRGMGKSFLLSVYPLLRALFMPRRKIIVVGAAFRQSKVLFEYMDTIWKNAPILRDLCGSNSGPRRDVDRCVMHIGQSTITCLPLGDGSKIRGQRANDIIADEFASIPRDIFENVVAGFAAVASSPIEKVKMKAKKKRAKELGVLNLADLNTSRLSNSKLISVFDRIKTNIDNNEPLMSKEVYVYTEWLGPTFNEVLKLMGDYREFRKSIELQPGLDSKTKRVRINELYAAENILLKQYIDLVANMDLDYVFESTMSKEFPIVPSFLQPRLPTRKRGKKEKIELTIDDFKF